jgi:hypothetical protein
MAWEMSSTSMAICSSRARFPSPEPTKARFTGRGLDEFDQAVAAAVERDLHAAVRQVLLDFQGHAQTLQELLGRGQVLDDDADVINALEHGNFPSLFVPDCGALDIPELNRGQHHQDDEH